MAKMPVQVWALILAFMGMLVALTVLFVGRNDNVALQVLSIGASLVSGALGAFAGHAIGSTKADVTTGGAPVTINQNEAQPEKKV